MLGQDDLDRGIAHALEERFYSLFGKVSAASTLGGGVRNQEHVLKMARHRISSLFTLKLDYHERKESTGHRL